MAEKPSAARPEPTHPPLALIAGTGDLPKLVAQGAVKRGQKLLIVRFEGTDAPWADDYDVLDLPFEKPGRLFKAMKERGARQVCFAGAMTRPRLDPLRFDLKALTLVTKVPALLRKGDDAMLRGLAAIFEGEGYAMVAAHDLLAGLLAPSGVLGEVQPSADDRKDIARARDITRALGLADVGQAAAVADGVCLGVEAIAGTDALLDEVARIPAHLRYGEAKGVLFKGPKPGQDWRMDLPAAGAETVRRAAAAGLSGICLQAGGVLVLGLDETIAEADKAGLFLLGLPESEDPAADPAADPGAEPEGASAA